MAEKQVIMGRVYKYFKERPDTIISLAEVEKDLELHPGSASPALSRMSTSVTYRISKGPHRGSYIYHSGPRQTVEAVEAVKPINATSAAKALVSVNPLIAPRRPTAQVYERVGKLNELADILRDEQDRLYVAMPLDTYINGKPTAH
jgi:hypothetical protein